MFVVKGRFWCNRVYSVQHLLYQEERALVKAGGRDTSNNIVHNAYLGFGIQTRVALFSLGFKTQGVGLIFLVYVLLYHKKEIVLFNN